MNSCGASSIRLRSSGWTTEPIANESRRTTMTIIDVMLWSVALVSAVVWLAMQDQSL